MQEPVRKLHLKDVKKTCRIRVIGRYKGSSLPFEAAKERAEEEGGKLISFKNAVNIIRLLATISMSENTLLKDVQGGVLLTRHNASYFFEGLSRSEVLSIPSHACPFWCGALKIEGPLEEEMREFNGLNISLPRQLAESGHGSIILDLGSWDSVRLPGGSTTYRVLEDATPITFPVGTPGVKELFLDPEGNFTTSNKFSKRNTDPVIPIFTYVTSRVRPLICAITPTDFRNGQKLTIRAGTLPPHERMGALMEDF